MSQHPFLVTRDISAAYEGPMSREFVITMGVIAVAFAATVAVILPLYLPAGLGMRVYWIVAVVLVLLAGLVILYVRADASYHHHDGRIALYEDRVVLEDAPVSWADVKMVEVVYTPQAPYIGFSSATYVHLPTYSLLVYVGDQIYYGQVTYGRDIEAFREAQGIGRRLRGLGFRRAGIRLRFSQGIATRYLPPLAWLRGLP